MAQEVAEDIPVSYESKRCNIVVLGVTGVGKSTVANKILRHNAFHVDPNKVTCVTKTVSCGERVIVGPESVMYSVKVVDTVGFSDPRRDPDEILKEIQTFFREKVVEGVSLVLFIVKGRRFTREVIDTIDRIKDHFKEISPMSALVITHCESLTDQARERFIKEFEADKDKDIADVCSFMQKGIVMVGFPDLSEFKETLRPTFQQSMEADVKALHQLIFQSVEMRLTSVMFHNEEFWNKVKKSEVINPPQSAADPTPKLVQGNFVRSCNVM